jgi:hypothetical protein
MPNCWWCDEWIEDGDVLQTRRGPMHEWCRDKEVEEETAALYEDGGSEGEPCQ